ncbi:tetratricopeptide repeat protein [Streptomyces sp. NPDC007088]|uniref:serine/threonine-protein kinase n=1 Tax=Streptomyces sp. NPDC007088 TaxID=3364773 RepID=UPI0036A2B927
MADTRLIQGRYRLLDLIGRGGMGEVWRARDESLGRRVAVKCLKPLGARRDADFTRVLRERFRREARVAAALQHRGVTVVHDFGEHEGVLYLVMEFLEGRNLSQLLEDHAPHPLPLDVVLDIAAQVAAALAHTHEQGVVHRDLKPANIMRLADGSVKICDFGIARLGHDIGFTSRLSGTGVAMGTPHYMSPEQIGGESVDRRSDLYSFGCVLYELATGQPPFAFDDVWAILVGHSDTAPRPPSEHRPEVPDHLDRVVLDLLAKDPGLRPQDAGDVVARLTEKLPTARPATEAPLPAWTRGMTAGHKAFATTGARHTVPPGTVTGLSATWAARAAGGVPAAAEQRRPTPAPELLAHLGSRHQAGLSLGRLGRWEEAGEVHRAVAAERAHLLGPAHPDTLASRGEIALSLSRTGRLSDALREYTRIAGARERTLGPEHPDTLTARHETGYVLGRLGRHFEAHEVYRRVLAARERTMGPGHPDTLCCRHNLAYTLGRLGRLEDSLRLAEETAVERSRVLGAGHPDTLLTRYEIAHTLGSLGRWGEALDSYRAVAAGRGRVLGAGHPDTLAARYEAGIALGRLGRTAEALELYRALVEDRTRAEGSEAPETLRARHGLGVNLGRLGRWEEALNQAREVAAARVRLLGPGHPDTLVSRREIAVALGWLGRWDEALDAYRTVAGHRERVLGATHPDTLSSRDDEAHCLEQLGRSQEAALVYREVALLRAQSRGSGP